MPVRIATLLVLALQMLFAQATKSSAEPKFKDYAVPVETRLKYVPPKFSTAAQRRFRTVIRDWTRKGPNFAGHYTIAEWGCGTGCVQMVVVDNRTGNVYQGPWGALPFAVFCFGSNPDKDKTEILYRRDSSLLIFRGCPNFAHCGTTYDLWNGSGFKVLRRQAVQPVFGCEP